MQKKNRKKEKKNKANNLKSVQYHQSLRNCKLKFVLRFCLSVVRIAIIKQTSKDLTLYNSVNHLSGLSHFFPFVPSPNLLPSPNMQAKFQTCGHELSSFCESSLLDQALDLCFGSCVSIKAAFPGLAEADHLLFQPALMEAGYPIRHKRETKTP